MKLKLKDEAGCDKNGIEAIKPTKANIANIPQQ